MVQCAFLRDEVLKRMILSLPCDSAECGEVLIWKPVRGKTSCTLTVYMYTVLSCRQENQD